MKKKHIVLIALLAVVVIALCLALCLRACSRPAEAEPVGKAEPEAVTFTPEPADETEPAEAEASDERPASEEAEPPEENEAAESTPNAPAPEDIFNVPGGVPEPGSHFPDTSDDEDDDGPMEVQDDYVVTVGENELFGGG